MRAAGLLEDAFSDGYFVVDEPKFKALSSFAVATLGDVVG